MQNNKQKAIELRKKGYSLSEISNELCISKSTASLWLRNIAISPEGLSIIAKKRSDARVKAGETNQRYKRERIVESEFYALEVLRSISLSLDTTRLLCSLIYWCEGAKLRDGSTFAFMNSDPNLVRTFLQLLREGFPINERKLRLQVHIHEYHDAQQQLLFWSNLTNIPLSQCLKPYIKPHTGSRTRAGYEGCASIRYQDIHLGRKIESIGKMFITQKGS